MKKWIIIASIVLLAIGITIGVIFAIGTKRILGELPDAYAIWGTGELVIEYLEREEKMPTSWDDLQPLWEEGHGMHARPGGVESFDDLVSMVDIEFERLDEYKISAKNGIEPPSLIKPKSGATTRWEGADAGEMIIYYYTNNRTNKAGDDNSE